MPDGRTPRWAERLAGRAPRRPNAAPAGRPQGPTLRGDPPKRRIVKGNSARGRKMLRDLRLCVAGQDGPRFGARWAPKVSRWPSAALAERRTAERRRSPNAAPVERRAGPMLRSDP